MSMATSPHGDNFKRSVMRVSRAALLLIPCGRSLDRAWSEASESAADEHAAQQSSFVALNLASALVRIARMIPKGHRQVIPASVSAFLVEVKTRRESKLEYGAWLNSLPPIRVCWSAMPR